MNNFEEIEVKLNKIINLVEIFKDNVSLGIFNNCMDLERQSEKLFGVKLLNENICMVANGKRKQYNNEIDDESLSDNDKTIQFWNDIYNSNNYNNIIHSTNRVYMAQIRYFRKIY